MTFCRTGNGALEGRDLCFRNRGNISGAGVVRRFGSSSVGQTSPFSGVRTGSGPSNSEKLAAFIMDFDEVISHVGELGRYQKWLFALLCVPTSAFSAVAIYNHIFVSAVVEHHCHLPVSAEKASLLQKSLAPTEVCRRSSKDSCTVNVSGRTGS